MVFASMLMRKLSVGRTDMPVEKLMPKELSEKDEVALDRYVYKSIIKEYRGK